jgi:mannose-6-phosphate isomerase-like protein (cupin superfamily)
MGGEVEFWMEDEKFIINKSCMIFVPAGVKHCPLYLKRVDRPIFHFTVVTSPLYSMTT